MKPTGEIDETGDLIQLTRTQSVYIQIDKPSNNSYCNIKINKKNPWVELLATQHCAYLL